MRLKDEFKVDQGYKVDPRRLKVDPGWNARHDTQELREANAELKASIKANGVLESLTGYVNGEEIIITNGHRRLGVTMELIAEGHEILTVPFRIETGNDADRCLAMITRNSGLRLTPLETAEVVKRLSAYGWDDAKIKAKTGFSVTYIGNLMRLLESPQAILNEVEAGKVSASLAVQVQKDNPAEAPAILQEAREIAKASGKAKTTPKHVKAAQEAREPVKIDRPKVDWEAVGPKLLEHLDKIFSLSPNAVKKAKAFRVSVFGEVA